MNFSTLFLFLCFSTVNAFASAWVEPAIGFQSGTSKLTDLSGGSNDGKGAGLVGTLKAGYIFSSNFALGLEYDYSNYKATDEVTNLDYATTANILGVHLGYYKIGGLRAYATYGFSNALKRKPDNGFEEVFTQGTAYKVGVGWQVALHVALNFEYQKFDPKKYSVGGSPEEEINSAYSKAEFSSLRFLVSFPFE